MEYMETVLPKKDKEAVKKVTTAEEERDSEEKVVMAVAKDGVKDVAKAVAMNSIMKEDIMKKNMDSTIAHLIAIGTMC